MEVQRVIVFSLLLIFATYVAALDVVINPGVVAPIPAPNIFDGYPNFYEVILKETADMRLVYQDVLLSDIEVDGVRALDLYASFPNSYSNYLNTVSFAPWPAAHTTVFTEAGLDVNVFVTNNGLTAGWSKYDFFLQDYIYYPAEFLGVGFDVPADTFFGKFLRVTTRFQDDLSRQYYYNRAEDDNTNWPYQGFLDPFDYSNAGFVTPFHVKVLTTDGYFYYDWLTPRNSQYWALQSVLTDDTSDAFAVLNDIYFLAHDDKGIEQILFYSMFPENNREEIYNNYNGVSNRIPEHYAGLYLEYFLAEFVTPSSTQTISATVTPTPVFVRQPTHTATRSPSGTLTSTPAPTHSGVYQSSSNTPSRTPNLSSTRTPTRSSSPVPSASVAPSASVIPPSNSPIPPTPSSSPIPVSATSSPVPSHTPTQTRTSFLTASNTQAPGRNVPSASIAPSASRVVAPFSQPGSSTAALVQFNVQCNGYCTGESASALQLAIARALNLNEEYIRIVAVHEFFEGDSEITLLICSNAVATVLNSIQAGTFSQDYFVSVSVESVDWTVRCDMDLYNYLALSSQYFATPSSSSQLVPALLLFFFQLWVLA